MICYVLTSVEGSGYLDRHFLVGAEDIMCGGVGGRGGEGGDCSVVVGWDWDDQEGGYRGTVGSTTVASPVVSWGCNIV